jgi:hypothetical protein
MQGVINILVVVSNNSSLVIKVSKNVIKEWE